VYNDLNKTVKAKIRETKQRELEEKYSEIEKFQERFDSFNVHRKVKELTEKAKSRLTRLIVNDGHVIINK